MKKTLALLITFSLPIIGFSQKDQPKELDAYFSALIVSNMDSSITWYSDNLGFEVLNKKEFPEMGFKQSNLKRGNSLIELIEIGSAISPKDIIPNYSKKTKIIGLFKIGFKVSNFNEWVDQLTKADVQFHGNVVMDDLTNKRMVIIKDPDGNRIQLFEK